MINQVLNVSDVLNGVFKRKSLMEDLIKIIVKFKAEKVSAHLYHAPNILSRKGHNIMHEEDLRLGSNTLMLP